MKDNLPELGDIKEAQKLIAGKLHRTPVFSSRQLGKRTDTTLFFKAEVFQKTGSFKPRGAINKLSHLSNEEKRRGVVALSSGNHAQGVAYAASLFGVKATLVMYRTASPNKIEATRNYGAEVVLTEDYPEATALRLQKERNLVLVHPYNDPYIVAGQGTVGLEILEDLPDVEWVFVQIGGGGIITGIATAIKSQKPNVKIIGVEAVGAIAKMYPSLKQGKIVHLDKIDTIAEGIKPPYVGEVNFALARKYVDDVMLVTDDEIVEAMCQVLEWTKIMAEPSGAASFAPVLFRKVKIPCGAKVVCLLSGGNINRGLLSQYLTKPPLPIPVS